MRANITVRNIDTKLFTKQRMALDRIIIILKRECIEGKRPTNMEREVVLLEGLANLTDYMADVIDGVDKS